jgi:nucleoside-diphosphate-sugar epimerase
MTALALGRVCVTGGSGFLGSWCVKLLLDQGYRVHITTRQAEKATYLRGLPGADRLTIFDGVDLLRKGSFDGAIAGCEAVLHTASPYYTKSSSEDKLVTPAVEGTRNVLDACRRLGVKRVALTASLATVYMNYGTLPADHVYTEADWSPEGLLRQNQNWYCLSKLLAERSAWEVSREEGCPFQLAVLHPALIWGPMLEAQPHLNTSATALLGYMDGTSKEIENAFKAVVDVRDVARAHIEAIQRDVGGQRFLLIGGCPHFKEVVRHIDDVLPESMKANVPTKVSEKLGSAVGGASSCPVLYDTSAAETLLGISFRSAEEQVKAMVTSMLDNRFTSSAQYVPDR